MARKKIKRRINKFDTGGWTYNAPAFQNSVQGLDVSQAKPLDLGDSNNSGSGGSGLFSIGKGNLASGISAAGNTAGSLISGGLSSTGGSVISALGDVASNFGPMGQMVGGGLNLLGGLFNAAFGSNINEQAVQEAKSQIGATGSQGFNAQNIGSGLNLMGTINKSDIGKDGWFSNKAKILTRDLNQAAYRANQAQTTALNTAANQVTQSTLNNLAANYAAYGGPMTMRYSGPMSPFGNQFGDGGGIHIKSSKRGTFTAAAKKHGKSVQEFASQVLSNKDKYSPAMVKKANFARNAAKWHKDGGYLFQEGGSTDDTETGVSPLGRATSVAYLYDLENPWRQGISPFLNMGFLYDSNTLGAGIDTRYYGKDLVPRLKAGKGIPLDELDELAYKAISDYDNQIMKETGKYTSQPDTISQSPRLYAAQAAYHNGPYTKSEREAIAKALADGDEEKLKEIVEGKAEGWGRRKTAIRTPYSVRPTYEEWKAALPSNLRNTDESVYDLRGAYEAGLEPVWVEEDQSYHLGSRNPKTGRILKRPLHPTFFQAILEDVANGYIPITKDGETYTIESPFKAMFGNERANGGYVNAIISNPMVKGASSVTGSLLGRKKAKKEARELNEKISRQNNSMLASYNNAAEKNKDRQKHEAMSKYYADGGPMYTHGGIFSNGITDIGSGGTHEQNPFEGVQMGVDSQGVPNLVEEDEVVFNDYVFSNRIRVPKAVRERYKLGNNRNMSFADAAKRLSKESEERPNDPISKNGLEVMLGELASIQEDERFKKQMRDPEFRRQVMEQLAMDEAAQQQAATQENQEMIQGQQAYQDPALQGMMFARGGRLGNLFDGTGSESQLLKPLNMVPFGGLSFTGTTANPQWLNMDTMFDGLSFDNSKTKGNIPYTHGSKSNLGEGVSAEDFNAFTDYALTLPDTDNYWTTLAEKTGKEIPWLRDNYRTLRNDGKYGWVSVTPQRADSGSSFFTAPDLKKEVQGLDTNKAQPLRIREEEPPIGVRGPKDNWMRYAPIAGSGIAVLNDFLGGNKPDYSNADMLLSAVNNSYFKPVSPRYIGEQLTYRPFDRNYYINKLNSSFNSTRRDIMNNGRGNRGAAMAGLLANSIANNESLGKLARQAEEYNMNQRKEVATFNRDTSKFNAEMGFNADKANQDALANYRNFRLAGLSDAAKLREAERLRVINDRAANLTNFLQGLGDLGREKTDRDMLRWMADLGVLMYNPYGEYTGNSDTAATSRTTKKKKVKSSKDEE